MGWLDSGSQIWGTVNNGNVNYYLILLPSKVFMPTLTMSHACSPPCSEPKVLIDILCLSIDFKAKAPLSRLVIYDLWLPLSRIILTSALVVAHQDCIHVSVLSEAI